MNEISQLLNEIVNQNLYQDLLKQLEKDFLLSNENIEISEKTTPQELITILHQKIYDLISFKFNEYLNPTCRNKISKSTNFINIC
jgi:hypothetical protein